MLCDRTKGGAAMWQRTKRAREISTTPSTHDRFTAWTERNSEAEIQSPIYKQSGLRKGRSGIRTHGGVQNMFLQS